jgi:membrane-associated phospholipid phosphatase
MRNPELRLRVAKCSDNRDLKKSGSKLRHSKWLCHGIGWRALVGVAMGVWLVLGNWTTCHGQSVQDDAKSPQKATEMSAGQTKSTPNVGNTSGSPQRNPVPQDQSGVSLLRNLAEDQKAIWTSPAKVRLGEATWLVPFAGVAAGFLVTDRDANLHMGGTPATLTRFDHFSNYGLAGMAGAGAGLYLLGKATKDERKREAGLLSEEAALDAFLVSTALGYATERERPSVDAFQGKFWRGGDAFPSSHAAGAWAIASVISHEYPGTVTKILAYSAATAVTFARVRAQQHFPSDALVGTGLGWLTGWQVYRASRYGVRRKRRGGFAGYAAGANGPRAEPNGFAIRATG